MLLIPPHSLQLDIVGVAVLLQVDLDLLLKFSPTLFSLSADHRVPETHTRSVFITVELLELVLVEFNQLRSLLRLLHLYLYLFINKKIPSRFMGVFSEVISSDTDLNNTIV